MRRTDTGTALGWVNASELSGSFREQAVLLGLEDSAPRFAVDIADPAIAADVRENAERQLTDQPAYQFSDARGAAMALTQAETGILAQARSQLDWHRRHGFCNSCGNPTEMDRGGQVRVCSGCNASLFPRTDPVAIMLVTDGERCLLGQPHGPLVRTGMYSALAGFIDQGESIEAAVRREVSEEAGISVGNVRYHSSQPWPFPYSLMIGCLAHALSTDIQLDPEEMADVAWFERDEVANALERAIAGEAPSPDHLSLPGPMAIAHHLVKAWIDND